MALCIQKSVFYKLEYRLMFCIDDSTYISVNKLNSTDLPMFCFS